MDLFLKALLVGYSGAMMPGPLLTYTIERSLGRGWKVGLLVPLGHVILEILIVALLSLGLGSVLQAPLPRMVILFAGGAMLLWFGFDMVRSAVKGNLAVTSAQGAAGTRRDNLTILLKSGLISVLNPYFLLWWATIGLGFLIDSSRLGIPGIALFYSGHAMADFTWYFAVSLLCDRIGGFLRGRAYRVIIAGLGAALAFFAVKFIIDGINLIGQV